MTALLSTLKRLLPESAQGFLRPIYLFALDLSDASARRRDMTPPRRISFVGTGDYKTMGRQFRNLFTEYGGLKPDHRVLDVGCGIGRMAVPLTSYLSAQAEYQGFDIVEIGVDWCQKNITPRYPIFHFLHADVRNSFYNPEGSYKSSNYRFPFEDRYFDFIFATSVFTHMLPPDMENYLKEISRVLKNGATCFITFFLMNEESEGCIRQKLSTQNFIHEIDGCCTTTPKNPENAIAFQEKYIRGLFHKFGLSISEPIHYGSWCGRADFLNCQDIVIARKV
jgi:ubiquinone/menaquinone biosynthesis C-methylase UbiE